MTNSYITLARKIKNMIFLGGCLLLIDGQTALNAQTYKKNKYGLKIISHSRDYHALVTRDSSQQLLALQAIIADLKTDFVYATSHNFTHQVLYKDPAAYLRRPAAIALKAAAAAFRKRGYGLLVFDAYRPYEVTVKMWAVVPDNRYAADPRHGSGHNKGVSIDLSLYELATGKPVPMPTGFDNFTQKAHQGYDQLPLNVRKNRELLKTVMSENGFLPLSTEWWHFSFPDPTHKFELMDLSFAQLQELNQ